MAKPIKTSERLPTIDDADDYGHVWVWCGASNEWEKCPHGIVRCHSKKYSHWAPKAKAVPPEPIKPEWREFWINQYKPGDVVGFAYQREDLADKHACNQRTECIHVREVLDGDPTPQQIEQARGMIRELSERFPKLTTGEMAGMIERLVGLLGG